MPRIQDATGGRSLATNFRNGRPQRVRNAIATLHRGLAIGLVPNTLACLAPLSLSQELHSCAISP
jgi:hypothetical protein